jgi:hypothetical protein
MKVPFHLRQKEEEKIPSTVVVVILLLLSYKVRTGTKEKGKSLIPIWQRKKKNIHQDGLRLITQENIYKGLSLLFSFF